MPSSVALPQLYSRATLVSAAFASPPAEVAVEPDRVRRLLDIEAQQSRRRACRREDRARRAVKAAHAGIRHRVDDAPGQFVAEHDRGQHVLAACRELSCSAIASAVAVSGVPQCTMLRRSLSSEAAASLITALTCAAPTDRQLGAAIEPHRGLRRAAALLRHVADDARRIGSRGRWRRWRSCWRSASPRARPPAPADRRSRSRVRNSASSRAVLIAVPLIAVVEFAAPDCQAQPVALAV